MRFPTTVSLRPTHLPRRPIFLAFLMYALYHNRQPFLTRLRAFARAFARAAHAVNLLSLVLSQTSSDVQQYLQPTSARRRSSSSATSQAQVPRSLRRLLKLASSPDSLAVLHRLAGGVAQGVTRELQKPRNPANSSFASEYMPDTHSPQCLHDLMEALAAPAGQAVVRNVVSTAVREGVDALADANDRRRDPCHRPWPEVVVAGLTSDKGRQLVVDVATNVARTVVPAVMQAQSAVQCEIPSMATLSPAASPLRKKRPPSCSPAARTSFPLAGESPISKQLVMSVMQAQGGSGIVERLALLAIRDKALVREVVRTVVSEAVRTYLTTQAKLREEGVAVDAARAAAASAVSVAVPNAGKDARKAEPPIPETEDALEQRAGNSLWKLLIKSAVVDLKQALLDRAPREGSAGWLIF